MTRTKRTKFSGATYHVYSLAYLKQYIFQDEAAAVFFRDEMIEYSIGFGVKIHAYCIMGNHYHLLLTTPEPNISEFMHDLLSSFGSRMVFLGWLGHVFAKRFDSVLVEDRTYLRTLVRYMHMNPVKAGIVTCPEGYPWSSWLAYVAPEGCEDHDWLETAPLLRQFDSDPVAARKKLKEFVLQVPSEACSFSGERDIIRVIANTEEEADQLKRLLSGDSIPTSDRERRRLLKVQGLREVYVTVLEHYGLEGQGTLKAESLAASSSKKCAREIRRVFIYLAKECTIATNGEIARSLGDVGETLVSHLYGDMKERVQAAAPEGSTARLLKGAIEAKRAADKIQGLGLAPTMKAPTTKAPTTKAPTTKTADTDLM